MKAGIKRKDKTREAIKKTAAAEIKIEEGTGGFEKEKFKSVEKADFETLFFVKSGLQAGVTVFSEKVTTEIGGGVVIQIGFEPADGAFDFHLLVDIFGRQNGFTFLEKTDNGVRVLAGVFEVTGKEKILAGKPVGGSGYLERLGFGENLNDLVDGMAKG